MTQKIIRLLNKIEPILLWLMVVYFSIMFIRNGVRKFDVEGFWAPAFERWGYPVWFMFLIGGIETVGGILILIPRVAIYGALPLAVVMLGALATRLIYGVDMGDAISISFNLIAMLYIGSIYASKETRKTRYLG